MQTRQYLPNLENGREIIEGRELQTFDFSSSIIPGLISLRYLWTQSLSPRHLNGAHKLTQLLIRFLKVHYRAPMLAFLLCMGQAASAAVKTLIVVPQTSGPAKEIYDGVISGIESVSDLNTVVYEINSDTTPTNLREIITANEASLVIPIGNGSYKICRELHESGLDKITCAAGGISGKPNGIPTLSLTASAETTIKQIQTYAPHLKEIRLVYNEKLNGWWYQQALIAGADAGITVIGYQANDIQEGVKHYEQLLKDARRKSSAVWLPLKGIVPTKTILPLVLERAWTKKLAVISNNPSHTRLGGLLAFYPDHALMGKQLAEFALAHYQGKSEVKITGTNSVKIAVNTRTSSHLGIRLDANKLENFDKVFPAMR